MKFKITFKDPDGVSDSLQDAASQSVELIEGISEDERDELRDTRKAELEAAIKPFVRYQEYLEVEFDTEANTATICKPL